ncbi:MAG: metallophosphoesterase N-terminal domain-containing protein, partial [Bacteroidota bacterium]
MRNIFTPILAAAFFLLPALNNHSEVKAQARTTVEGVVFHDKNENTVFDSDEDEPLEGIAVSNGHEVVVTDRKGEYELPLRNNSATFVIKPRNWAVPVDEEQNPRFYQMFSGTGVAGTKFEGLEATGLLPESVNFPLYPSQEPDKLKVLVFGDTQPRDDKEIHYMSADVLPELIGADADFGVTLGDVVFDDLNLYDHIKGAHASIGIPWRYVAGNHDYDYTGNNSTEARGTWYKHFGPSYYSFTHGPAHFVVL